MKEDQEKLIRCDVSKNSSSELTATAESGLERFVKWYLSWVAKNESSRVSCQVGLDFRTDHMQSPVQRKPEILGSASGSAGERSALSDHFGLGKIPSARTGAQSGGGNRTRTHPLRDSPSPSVGPQVPPGNRRPLAKRDSLRRLAQADQGLGPLTRYLLARP